MAHMFADIKHHITTEQQQQQQQEHHQQHHHHHHDYTDYLMGGIFATPLLQPPPTCKGYLLEDRFRLSIHKELY
jgi:hypothetical protein